MIKKCMCSDEIFLQSSNGDTDIGDRLTDTVGVGGRMRKERVGCMERVTWKYTLPCVK